MEYEITIVVRVHSSSQGEALSMCERAITGGMNQQQHPQGMRVTSSSVKVVSK